MAEIKKIDVKRNSVQISCSSNPQVFVAEESVTWQGGQVRISGLGQNRADALVSLDSQFELLKKILAETPV